MRTFVSPTVTSTKISHVVHIDLDMQMLEMFIEQTRQGQEGEGKDREAAVDIELSRCYRPESQVTSWRTTEKKKEQADLAHIVDFAYAEIGCDFLAIATLLFDREWI